ncbi:MAG: hypothetical protein JRD89_13710 [Deltaproteobacteria bacterium]|nr:hypothetical protein [Deltaproteobacteria bacterium]
MADRTFNLFLRLFVLRTRKDGANYWDKVTETRLDESFTDVPVIAEALKALADSDRVDLDLDPKNEEISLLVEEIKKAKARTRSSVTEAAFDAWIHKLNGIRAYARKVAAKAPGNVNVELAAWTRNAS